MRIALDPWMIRTTPLLELPRVVADHGYEYIELSPREDFLPFFLHPRADRHSIAAFKRELDAAGVRISSVLPLYRWPVRMRTSGRPPSATGSGRSSSPSSSAATS